MKKITCLVVLLFLSTQTSFSQERYSRIKISQPTETTIHKIVSNGIDLNSGSANDGVTYTTLSDYTLSGAKQSSHTEAWKTQSVDLSLYDGQSIKLTLSETTSSNGTIGWQDDISLDNFGITSDNVSILAPPVAVCQNINVLLDASGNAVIVATDVDGGSTDDVGITNYAIDIDTFNCSNIGTPVDVTLTVTDEDNQTDTCVATITVLDQIDPEFVNMPSDFIITCGNNQPTWTNPTSTDNCATGLTPNRSDLTGLNSGDVFPTGITTISYSVNDGNGNIAAASFTVNVVLDTENPNAICQNITVQLDGAGNAIITAAQINNNSTDNCGIGTVVASQTSFTCADVGANNVTLTVTDTNGNVDTCIAVVTITLQDEPITSNCWETTSYNSVLCQWEINGSQDPEPSIECYETVSFSTISCTWVIKGTQPVEPAAVDCWDNYQFNNTNCTWENQGTQPVEPTGLECWETTSFNNGTCLWEVSGTQPLEPTGLECWETTSFNNGTCLWEVSGTQPVEPTGLECWETTSFNNGTCLWEVSGTQPVEPTAVDCWDNYQFNNTNCTWENQGTQPLEPTGIECWETTTFNVGTCLWEVSGTQPAEPTGLECWETTSFNNGTCLWEVSGTQPVEPAAVDCWDNYQFNNTNCTWENQGTQPLEPTGLECWETTSFNTGTCLWEVSGTQPVEPTAVDCWDNYQFNNTNCTWENQGTQPAEPTGIECWETTSFNVGTCLWEVSGTQPVEPTGIECWETTSFNNGTCLWEVSGTQPVEPTAVNCWDNYQFNNTNCTWENQGTQPLEPTGIECWEITSFNTETCLWEVSGTQPVEPTAVNCWDNYQFNNTNCTWENQGIAPIVPTGLNAGSITDTSAIISWNAMASFDFDLRYREVGAVTWIDILDVMTNTQALTLLTPFTQYEVEVRSKCSVTETSGYSTTLTFVTLESEPSDYCDSESNGASGEYISRVQLGDIDNVSGSQNYSDFTAISTVLRKGTQHTITITPTWSGTVNNEAYSVWIDYNKDGDFDDVGEEVVSIAPTLDTSITGDFTIPSSALDTKTRMRVTMKYNVAPTPCEIFDFGEVEDYTLIIVGSNDLIYTSSTWTPNAPSLTTITDNVFVLDGTYTVASDIQVNNMSVCAGAGIVVEKAIAMTVNGILKTADNVVLESDSNEYSSLFVENFVVGTAQYKRHVNAVASVGGSDLIAAPFYGESFIDFRADNPNILSNGPNTLFLFGPFDKILDIYLLYTNTETAPLLPGIGYRAGSTDAGTFTFTGDVKIGDLSVPVVNDGPLNPEWNLVGNPYPAYLSLSDFLAANSLQFETESSGVYGYDGFASDGWTIWNQGYSDANPNALITPGQGFLIASATNNGQIEFTASMRRTGNADDFILGRQGNIAPISHLKLKLDNTSNAYHTDFYFTENASLGQDPNYDSGLFGTAPALAIYSRLVEDNVGRNYGVQSIGSTNLSDVTIPLGINVSAGQQATISITERSLPENVEVYLEDNLTNTFTLLNTTDYIFTANTNITGTGRFFISFAESTLGTESPEANGINIFTTTQPKALYVKGQLLEDSELTLFDLQGRLIRSWTLGSDKISHRIDASSLSAGVYFVTLKNDFQRITEKIVIK
jgi:hypothetical protein